MSMRESSTRRKDPPAGDAQLHANTEPYRDLCSNCDNAPTCHGDARGPSRPVFFCEMFTAAASHPSTASGPATGDPADPESDPPPAGPPSFEQNPNGRSGLCVNCEFVTTCTLPNPEGGVWHCEEYR